MRVIVHLGTHTYCAMLPITISYNILFDIYTFMNCTNHATAAMKCLSTHDGHRMRPECRIDVIFG